MPSGNASDQAAYLAEYRRNNPEYVEAQRMQSRAKGKALRRLAAAHPAEYARLVSEELQKEKQRDQQADQQQR